MQATLFVDIETLENDEGHICLASEHECALLNPNVGDIWFTPRAIPLSGEDEASNFYIVSRVMQEYGAPMKVTLNKWSGNPYLDIQQGYLNFSKEGTEYTLNELSALVLKYGLEVSRNTPYRLLEKEDQVG